MVDSDKYPAIQLFCTHVHSHTPTLTVEPNVDECNLLYVAVTRAKKRLIMSPYLVTLLQKEKV